MAGAEILEVLLAIEMKLIFHRDIQNCARSFIILIWSLDLFIVCLQCTYDN